MRQVTARDFMVTKVVTLRPEVDVMDAVDLLLRRRISGAPVVGPRGEYLGVFSERCTMQVFLDASYEQLPSSHVGAYMDTEAITAGPDTHLLSIAQVFLLTSARRLPIVDDDGQLLGQVSRRDVIRAARDEMCRQPARESSLLYLSALLSREESPVA